jgi:2-desacetyl-2-hydroxyethyl bacteriochlorophyllide A dehydrogenase
MRGLAKTAARTGHLDVIEVEDPDPAPEEVLVEVAFAGLCGSDLGIYRFEEAYESIVSLPRIVGHEYAGTVLETGADVERFAPGNRVVERPIRACGACYQCETGSPNVCANARITGVHHDGAYAGRIAVPAGALNRVPGGIDERTAALAEPTSVAVRAASHNADVAAGDRVLVEGPGPIGLLAARVAAAEGAEVAVSGIDRDADHRLPFAAGLGFETVNVAETPIEDAADRLTGGRGFDVVIDATGAGAGLEAAAGAVRKGGQVVLVGQTGTATVEFTPLIRGEVDLQCSYASTWKEFERALSLLADGEIAVDGFVDDRFSIREADAAFEAFAAGETCKPLFDLSELR